VPVAGEILEVTDLDAAAGLPLVLALSGWGNASGVAVGAAARLVQEAASPVAVFDPDELFDYRSNRPVLHFVGGELQEVDWPRLAIDRVEMAGRSILVGHGSEPDFRWHRLAGALVAFARRAGIPKLVTLGAVPAPVPHTRPVRVVCTASDATLLAPGDEALGADLVVPAAAVSVIRHAVAEAGIPAIGYWAQVPHYVNEPYHAGELALLERLSRQLDIEIPVGTVAEEAAAQREELDRVVASREDARAYVAKLESIMDEQEAAPGLDALPSADELVDEIERFLRNTPRPDED